ncbi:MAG TPA: hypothetical protein VGS99_06510, partial [Gammaproteobacteria bacterium]|nr:hypothetical protein [Gammaproteobacteria bacterium]
QCAIAGACTSTLPTTPSPQVAGAGRIDLAAAARAGFVLDESFTGQQALINANTNPTAAALQGFNLASLGDMQCISSCSWTRLITSTQVAASLNYTITMPSWMTVSVNGGAASSSGNLMLNNSASATLVFTATMQQASWNSWQFGEVDFTTSSNADDGSPPPAQHFPVAVYNQQPLPHMGVSPDNLLQGLSVGESAKSQTVTISNSGVLPLNWTLTSTATGTGPIVQRVLDSSGVGFPSDAFTADRHGIYLADSFSMAVSGAVTSITAMGFTQGGTSTQPSLADATQVAWYVYADANGVPAGNPEGGAAPIWSFTAAPSASGVTLVDSGNMVLNLATAGAPALNLSAGTYWLSVVPTFSNSCSYGAGGVISGGCAGEAWYWGESAPGSGKASYIDPANLLGSNAGAATGWTLMGPDTQFSQDVSGSVSLAFGLAGTLNCPANLSLGGVSLSPTSGSVAPGGSASVTANFDPTGISPGTYNGAFCVQGNDSNTPFVAVPVTETVTAATGSGGGNGGSGGGGGGGGAFGVLGLLMLFVPWMARGRGRSGG